MLPYDSYHFKKTNFSYKGNAAKLNRDVSKDHAAVHVGQAPPSNLQATSA